MFGSAIVALGSGLYAWSKFKEGTGSAVDIDRKVGEPPNAGIGLYNPYKLTRPWRVTRNVGHVYGRLPEEKNLSFGVQGVKRVNPNFNLDYKTNIVRQWQADHPILDPAFKQWPSFNGANKIRGLGQWSNRFAEDAEDDQEMDDADDAHF